MKKNIQLLIKYISIVLITVVIMLPFLYGFIRLVTPKGEIEKFYDEPKNSIDVLIVGSSHSMAAFSSTEIYENTGLTAYNLSTWSQPIWISYHYLIETLKYQSPKLVVVDAFGAFYDKSYITGVDIDLVSNDFASLIKPSLNLLALNISRYRCQVTRQHIDEYFNITKYHSRINSLEAKDFDSIFKDDKSTAKGYGRMYNSERFRGYECPQTDITIPLYPQAYNYLEKIIELSKKEGFKLAFVKTPYVIEENDVGLINEVARICAENEIDFIDYNVGNIADVDFAIDMADHGHINYVGRLKTSRALSDYINTLNLSGEYSQDILDDWQFSANVEHRDFEQMNMRLQSDFSKLVDSANAAKYNSVATVIMRQGDLVADDYSAIKEISESCLIPDLVRNVENSEILVLVDNNILSGQSAKDYLENIGAEFRTDDEGKTHLIYEEFDYSRNRDGLNLALYDENTQKFFHYISFAREHQYTAYTN